MDTTFVEVPRQRNSSEENALVKQGQVPETWRSQPRKLAQKDTEAQRPRKGGASFIGHKNAGPS